MIKAVRGFCPADNIAAKGEMVNEKILSRNVSKLVPDQVIVPGSPYKFQKYDVY